MSVLPLEGLSIGITADRRWQEQATLLERRGAAVQHGPTMTSRYLEQDSVLREATEAVIACPPDYLVANTGIGMRGWLMAAETWGLLDALVGALAGARVLARGPKAAAVVQQHGLDVWARAVTERLDELQTVLADEPLDGRRIAVQEHGDSGAAFVETLRGAGAIVVELPVYRWYLPDDLTPARRLVDATCNGRLDAVTFTSAPAVHNLFAIATEQGSGDALRGAFETGTVAACVGSVCAEAARDAGIAAPLWPATGRLGLLVRALSDHFKVRGTELRLAGETVRIQGNLVAIGDDKATLTPRERGVLELLVAKPGAVVSRTRFLQHVWGSAAHDPHALEMTVARLRSKLGPCRDALQTVAGRGYRIQHD
jgi:uroporphyrinogen-III synthase